MDVFAASAIPFALASATAFSCAAFSVAACAALVALILSISVCDVPLGYSVPVVLSVTAPVDAATFAAPAAASS